MLPAAGQPQGASGLQDRAAPRCMTLVLCSSASVLQGQAHLHTDGLCTLSSVVRGGCLAGLSSRLEAGRQLTLRSP